MKKSELTQLTQIIEHLVAKEVRKQLPKLIAEAFQNLGARPVISETKAPAVVKESTVEPPQDEFKASLRELFAGVTPTGIKDADPTIRETGQPARTARQYTKNPVLNQILNETTGDLRSRERMVGAAAFQGGYSSMPAMAAVGPGEMMPDTELSFMKNAPSMPGPGPSSLPMGTPAPMVDGQESSHAPAAAIPEGISALDVARSVPLAAPVTQALTKNYSALMKAIDKKKKGVMG